MIRTSEKCRVGKLCCAKRHRTTKTVPTSTVTAPVTEQLVTSHIGCETLALPKDKRRRLGFWAMVLKTDCCWLWTRALVPGTRYGAFWVDGKLYKAHRVAYEELVGPIPDGLDLMHDCDVRHCVRPGPGHTRPGTHAENMHDMSVRGRAARQDGERNGNARLTWSQVREIRSRYRRGEAGRLAVEYGTTPAYIYSIMAGRVWRERKSAEAVA